MSNLAAQLPPHPTEVARHPIAWALASSSCAHGIVQFNTTLLNVALPSLKEAVGATVADVQWIVNSYTLGFLALILVAGAVGDRFGTRRVLLAGFISFALASMACAMAATVEQLVIARAVQGIGAALLLPNSLSMLKHACGGDSGRLASALGIWAAVGGAAYAAGPVAGGALLALADSRWLFTANVPLCMAGFLCGLACRDAGQPAKGAGSWDWSGLAVTATTLLALAVAVTESTPLGLAHPVVAGAALTVVLGTMLLVWIERRAPQPILPPSLFANGSFNATLAYGFLVNFAFANAIFMLNLFLQSGRGYTPLEAGVAFIPLTMTLVVSNMAGAWLLARYGFRIPMGVGALCAALGYALLFHLGEHGAMPRLWAGFLLIPTGVGIAMPVVMAATLAHSPPQLAGTASAVMSGVRQLAALLGIAVTGLLVGDGARTAVLAGTDMAMAAAAGLLVIAAALARLPRESPPRT